MAIQLSQESNRPLDQNDTVHEPTLPLDQVRFGGFISSLSIVVCVISMGCASRPGQDIEGTKFTDETAFRHPELGEFLNTGVWRRMWIVTGGQTGVDRAALDVALELNLPTRGWCPLGREAEDGIINSRYPLQEVGVTDPAMRTELNAFDSDGTLVLSAWQPKDGTPLTVEMAELHAKPYFVIDLSNPVVPPETLNEFRSWVVEHDIRILNIGGPRDSLRPGEVYRNAKVILRSLLMGE